MGEMGESAPKPRAVCAWWPRPSRRLPWWACPEGVSGVLRGGGLGVGRGLAAGGVRWLLVEWVGESGCWWSLLGRVMVWGGAGRSLLGVVREVLWGWGSERDFAL